MSGVQGSGWREAGCVDPNMKGWDSFLWAQRPASIDFTPEPRGQKDIVMVRH